MACSAGVGCWSAMSAIIGMPIKCHRFRETTTVDQSVCDFRGKTAIWHPEEDKKLS